MRKIKQGDEVIVTAGRDKGRRGRVTRIVADGGQVVVENANTVKKHQRGNPQAGTSGGIVEQEKPLDISNVALYNPTTGKGDRVGFRVLDSGDKVRVFKSNNEQID